MACTISSSVRVHTALSTKTPVTTLKRPTTPQISSRMARGSFANQEIWNLENPNFLASKGKIEA